MPSLREHAVQLVGARRVFKLLSLDPAVLSVRRKEREPRAAEPARTPGGS